MTQNPIASCPAPAITASATDPAAVLAQLRAGAPLDLATPAEPAKVLRAVPVSCRCLNHLEHGEPAPRTPLVVALRQADRTEADALDHLAKAACWHYHLESVRDADEATMTDAEGNRLETRITAAYNRLRALERGAAQRWGICLDIHHDY